MDDFDRKLLDIVQVDCSLSHAEIGRRVSLSASAVRRRLSALKTAGVIAAEVAILGEHAQLGITVLVSVSFHAETADGYRLFRERMQGDPHVLQCYSVAGQFDFMLVVAAASPGDYERWGEHALLSDPLIRRYDSFVVWSATKFTTRRPLFQRGV